MAESFFREEPEPSSVPPPDINEDSLGRGERTKDQFGEDLTAEDDRLAAVMSYIPFLCFIPLINVNWRDNKAARFHARQGVILFLIEITAVLMLIDDLAKFIARAVFLFALALAAVGVYFALQGKSFRLPIISDLADKAKL